MSDVNSDDLYRIGAELVLARRQTEPEHYSLVTYAHEKPLPAHALKLNECTLNQQMFGVEIRVRTIGTVLGLEANVDAVDISRLWLMVYAGATWSKPTQFNVGGLKVEDIVKTPRFGRKLLEGGYGVRNGRLERDALCWALTQLCATAKNSVITGLNEVSKV